MSKQADRVEVVRMRATPDGIKIILLCHGEVLCENIYRLALGSSVAFDTKIEQGESTNNG